MGFFDSIGTFFDRITTLPGGGSPAPVAAPPPPVMPAMPSILQQQLRPMGPAFMPFSNSGAAAAQMQTALLFGRNGRSSTILTSPRSRRRSAGDTSFDTFSHRSLGGQ